MLRYWLGFNKVPGIGAKRLRALLDVFGDIQSAWAASSLDLIEAGLDRRSLKNLLRLRGELDLEEELQRVQAAGITTLTWEDDSYPANLRQIDAPPPVLFVRGELLVEDEWAIAVVGTRRATVYGREVALRLSTDLARLASPL